MDKQIFKLYDRVFDISFGWGVVKYIKENASLPIGVKFKDIQISYTLDGKLTPTSITPTLSFTSYSVNKNFSQKRPIDPKKLIGKWGKFWNDNKNVFIIGQLSYYNELNSEKPYKYKDKSYTFFKPFSEEQVRILKL